MRITVRGSVTAAAVLAGAVALSMSLSGCSSISGLINQAPGRGSSAPAVTPVVAKPVVVEPAPVVPAPAPTSLLVEAKSMGGKVTTVPNTLNLSVTDAVEALRDAHLTYLIIWRSRTTADSRSVVGQSPRANATVDLQAPVTITVQTGRRSGTIDVHRTVLEEYAPWEVIPAIDTWDVGARGHGGAAIASPTPTPTMPDWFWREDVN